MALRSFILSLVLLVLVGAASAVLIADHRRQVLCDSHNQSFQHLTGGLGFGPALEISDCSFAFDPRLDGGCQQDCGPIAGGSCFCPRHAGSIFYYPPLVHGKAVPIEDKSDALSP